MQSRVATVHSEALPAGARTTPRCQLVVVEGPDMGRGTAIDPARELVVGTDPSCDLVLTDERVSHRHVAVRAERGQFVVRDLKSRNGTVYEGSVLIESRVPPGATFKLGRTFVRIQPEPQALEVRPSASRRFGELVAESLAMREVFAVLELASAGDVTVLLEGETGTGKELAARAVHDASARRRGPFVAVDCGALPEGLLESELFGHVKGAFTGASQTRTGAFARAHGGSIFLDELGSVPLVVQARLLRVIEERKVRPVGSDQERAIDVRVIAASRDSLATQVAEGRFRPDLWYRLSVLRVVLPPLRTRREDVPPLVAELLRRRGIEPGAIEGPNLDRLVGHGWPGNVRELRNVIDRAVALAPAARSFTALRTAVEPAAPSDDDVVAVSTSLPWAEAKEHVLRAFELRYLRDAMSRAGGNLSAASRATGIDRKHLRAMLRRHGLVEPT